MARNFPEFIDLPDIFIVWKLIYNYYGKLPLLMKLRTICIIADMYCCLMGIYFLTMHNRKGLYNRFFSLKIVTFESNSVFKFRIFPRKRILRKGSHFTFFFDDNYNCSKMKAIEHVKVELSLQYTPRGIMEMYVISPYGTKSQLLYERKFDSLASTSTYKGLLITSLHFWGENPAGEWTVLFKTAESLSSHGRPYGEQT